MFKNALYVLFFGLIVAVIGVVTLYNHYLMGPIVLGLTLVPMIGLFLAHRSFKSAIPDLIFGAIDTGLLTIPAIWGGLQFGVIGAIAGGVIGDAITDSIAGFFEGGIAEWLRNHNINTSREPIATALGKMGGCLLGSGLVLTTALIWGIRLN